MRGILRQISSSHDVVQTKELDGVFTVPPTVGQSFVFFIESPDAHIGENHKSRGLQTSTVKDLRVTNRGRKIKFETRNSVYELEITNWSAL